MTSSVADEAHGADAYFAENMAARRKELGLSQEQLAVAMSDQGLAWTQATVWKVEQQQRTVKVAEAVALERILDVRWRDLTRPRAEDAALAAIDERSARMTALAAELEHTARLFLEARDHLALDLVRAKELGLNVGSAVSWLHETAFAPIIQAHIAFDDELRGLDPATRAVEIEDSLRAAGLIVSPSDRG